jgi:dTDP-4-amino-4,6-dideoxygalactose transaminase
MNAQQPSEFPQRSQRDDAAWDDFVNSFGCEFADCRGAEQSPTVANGTNAVELALQCLIDSYRAFFGL